MCLFTVCRREPTAAQRCVLGWSSSSGSGATSDDHMFHQHTARSRQGEESSFVLPSPSGFHFFSWFHFVWHFKLSSPARLLSTVFACEVGGRGNTSVGAARGRKAALSESLPVLLAHRGPVVETSNQPTDRHKKLESISHYFEENLKLIDGSITNAS